jgi:leucyl aminopeptidase (aminopeptidase T)
LVEVRNLIGEKKEMDLSLGTEVRDEYLGWEVQSGARKLVEEVMLTKKREHVVITADTSSDMRVVNATAGAVLAAGAVPTVILYPTQKTAVMEPPPPVAGAIRNADVWIEFAVAYILHTEAYKEALKSGVRYICLTGMDALMMVQTIERVRYGKLLEMGSLLCEIVQKADKVEITAPAGTDLVAFNQGRRTRQSGKLADTKGEPIMLGGQISWCPVEETINGRIVFDGALWPPAELGKLYEPVTLDVKNGVVTAIRGGSEAKIFERWMAGFNDPNMYRIAHYSLGFNPGVIRPTGRIVEDERIFGCIELGIGSQGAQIMGKTWSAASHTDGVILNPTILLDGAVMEKNGVYQIPQLIDACQKLGVPGY